MNNTTKLLEAVINEYLNQATVVTIDLHLLSQDENAARWIDYGEEATYFEARGDLLRSLLAMIDPVLVDMVWNAGETLAKSIINEHADWIDPMTADLTEGDPFLELPAETVDTLVTQLARMAVGDK